MKHTTLLVLLLLLLSATTFAQSPEKEITIKKMLGEYQLFQGGQRISFGNACKVMQTNPEAYKII